MQLPLALAAPDGFDVEHVETWPQVTGRLEYTGGRLEYMPPCGEVQQQTAADVITELNLWRRSHPEFVVGGNEAGMLLGGEVRAADAAVWRRESRATGGFARSAPVLAVEVTGSDDSLERLREKARWYLDRGVETVWIVLPETRQVEAISAAGKVVIDQGGRLPDLVSLPGLSPLVADFFRRLEEG